MHRGKSEYRKDYYPRTNFVKDDNGDLKRFPQNFEYVRKLLLSCT